MQTNTPFWRAVQLSGASLQPDLIDRKQDLEHDQTHAVPLDAQRMAGADQVDDRALGASHQFKLAVDGRNALSISGFASICFRCPRVLILGSRQEALTQSTLRIGRRAKNRSPSRRARTLKPTCSQKDLGCFQALTSSTGQKALGVVGTAFVTPDGAL